MSTNNKAEPDPGLVEEEKSAAVGREQVSASLNDPIERDREGGLRRPSLPQDSAASGGEIIGTAGAGS
jgi:hypothetical protein